MHEGSDVEVFDDVTEQDIIKLWESLKAAGMSSNAAWDTILTGIALDMAFPRTKKMSVVEH
jgi:predicted DNA-binding transcriptional regulator AlpA|tara:strand:+ start:718 stop:900 length:183 start_codon:yes stop_codon:yes gene_type:complete